MNDFFDAFFIDDLQHCEAFEPTNPNNHHTMSTTPTTTIFACKVSSPKSVVHHAQQHIVEPLVLPNNILDEPQQKRQKKNEQGSCPASAKSTRTVNPIRAIIDPSASKIRLGCQRADGKNPISLAVSKH